MARTNDKDDSTILCTSCHKVGVPFSKRQVNRAMMGGDAKCRDCVQREELAQGAVTTTETMEVSNEKDNAKNDTKASTGKDSTEANGKELEGESNNQQKEINNLSKEERKLLKRQRKEQKKAKKEARKKRKKDKESAESHKSSSSSSTSSGDGTSSNDIEGENAPKFSDGNEEAKAHFSDNDKDEKTSFSDDDQHKEAHFSDAEEHEEKENKAENNESKFSDTEDSKEKEKENKSDTNNDSKGVENNQVPQIPRKRNAAGKTQSEQASSSLIANLQVAKPKPTLLDVDDDDEEEDEYPQDEPDDTDPYDNTATVSVRALKRRILGRQVRTQDDDDNDDDDEEEDSKPAANRYTTSHQVSPELRKELSCAICHETFLHPCSLMCGHSFCQECIHWWWQSNNDDRKKNNCPTCRQVMPLSKNQQLGVNYALRACVMALLGDELQVRLQAAREAQRKSTRGENEGAHDAGYAVLATAEADGWKQCNGIPWPCRRSIILDAEDQRMQLALGIWRDSSGGMYFNEREQSLSVWICLLTMEEDEAADGGFPRVVDEEDGEDNEHLLVSRDGGRFVHSFVRAMAKHESGTVPLGRRGITASGIVEMCLDLSAIDFSSSAAIVVSFEHEESGATLDLKVHDGSSPRAPRLPNKALGRSASTALTLDDEEEEEGHQRAIDSGEEEEDGSHLDHFEEDGFISQDGDEEEDLHDDDLCTFCKVGGHLIVCDGGDNIDGCARSFHIGCINHDVVPPGDWICQDCARGMGRLVGVEGYEFPVKLERDCDECNGDGAEIVCDGGDHVEGCGAAYHLECITRTVMPRGNWICHQCAHELSLDVDVEGYVFPRKRETIELSDDNDDVGSPLDSQASSPAGNKKRKRLAKAEPQAVVEIDSNSDGSEAEKEDPPVAETAGRNFDDDQEEEQEESEDDELEIIPPVGPSRKTAMRRIVDSDDDE